MSKKKTNEDKEIPGNLNDSSDSLAADFEVPAFDDGDISVDKPLSDIPDAPVKDEVLFGSADEPDLSFPDFTSDPFLSSDPTTEEKASDNFLSDIDIGMDSPAENTSQGSERNFKISKEADEFDLPDIGQIDTSSLELPSFQDTFNETPEDAGAVDGSDTSGADSGLGDLDLSGLDTGAVDGSGDLGDLDLSLPETDVIEETEGLDLPDTEAAGESSSLADIDLPVPESNTSGAESGLGDLDLPDLDAGSVDGSNTSGADTGLGEFDLPDLDAGSVDGSDTSGADSGLGDLDLSGLDAGAVDGSDTSGADSGLGDLDLSGLDAGSVDGSNTSGADAGLGEFDLPDLDAGTADGSDTAGADTGLGDLDLPDLDADSVDGSDTAGADAGLGDLDLPDLDAGSVDGSDAAGADTGLGDLDLSGLDAGTVDGSDTAGADTGLGEFDLPDLDADTADAGSSVDTGDGLGDFDLPDFGDSGLSEQPAASASTGAVGLGGIFDDDFGEVNLENNDTSFDDSDLTSPGFDPTDFGSDDGLETQAAQYDDLSDGEETERKSKVPVILIILIAILCLLGGSFLGFMFGRNLKKAKSETSTVTNIEKEEKNSSKKEVESETSSAENPVEVKPETEEKSSSVQPAESESSKKESAESVEKAPAAVEDQIVIASVPEAVVPEQPPKPETRPEDIRYTVKWGDTLWDIAEAYYKNPWRYTTIAKYNGLKNPDKIVAGSTLLIPAE